MGSGQLWGIDCRLAGEGWTASAVEWVAGVVWGCRFPSCLEWLSVFLARGSGGAGWRGLLRVGAPTVLTWLWLLYGAEPGGYEGASAVGQATGVELLPLSKAVPREV